MNSPEPTIDDQMSTTPKKTRSLLGLISMDKSSLSKNVVLGFSFHELIYNVCCVDMSLFHNFDNIYNWKNNHFSILTSD